MIGVISACFSWRNLSVLFILKEVMSETKLQGEMKPDGGGSEPLTTQELLQRLRELEVGGLPWPSCAKSSVLSRTA